MIPHRVPFFLPLLYPSLRWRMPPAARELYLTFDDGPVPGPTGFVLDVLERFSVKATFFCIGDNIRKHPQVFTKILQAGHHVGNHTFHHVSGWKTTADAYVQEVARCAQEMAGFSEHMPGAATKKLFRPPYGRITRRQIGRLQSAYEIIMWDVLSVDYDQRLRKEDCLKNTLRAVRPGSIVVFHDSGKAAGNLRYALPRFIESCLAQGYTFKPLTA